MKYLFLNHFAFENIDSSINQKEIIELFTSLAQLAKAISELNSHLIFDNKLSSSINYIKLIEDRTTRVFLMAKIRHPKPFCSDSFDEYFEDENIVLGNCVVDGTDIDILENFLACAIFLNSPIITPKSICKNSYFLNDTIDIKCDNELIELKNYFLENKASDDKNFNQDIIEDIKEYIDSLDLEITKDNFWEKREEFFPEKIIFCKEVEKQIKEIDERTFQHAIGILRGIETNKKPLSKLNISNEGDTVTNNKFLHSKREFTLLGKKEFFEKHIKNFPNNKHRIHFLEKGSKIYIGYIGKHLPNKNDK